MFQCLEIIDIGCNANVTPAHIHCFISGSKLTFSTHLFHQSASTHLDCLLGLYWTGFTLLNGFSFLVFFSFFLFWVVW